MLEVRLRSRTRARIVKKPTAGLRALEALGLVPKEREFTFPKRLSVIKAFRALNPEDLQGLLRHAEVHNLTHGQGMPEEDEERLAQTLGGGLGLPISVSKRIEALNRMARRRK